MTTLAATLDMLRGLKSATGMKVNRNFEGFFADRIVQAFAEPTLLDAIERLAKAVDASVEYVGGKRTVAFMSVISAPDASAVLAWIREHPRVVAMIAALRDENDYGDALDAIRIEVSQEPDESVITAQPEYQIPIMAELLSPLAHGADGKAGNATLFRRRQAITATGRILTLPFYSGNALRGQMRDLLADHLLSALGLTPRRDRPPIALWFFHALYAGSVLEEQGRATAAVDKEIGKSGALRTEGLRRLRDHLPSLSLLGAAIGNKVLPGRCQVGDLRPACREWGSGETPSAELMEWTFLTRRDDYEGRGEDDDHAGMIANTECLKAGTRLIGGIDIDSHANEIEQSALGMGLALLANRGWLGAENRRGLGKVRIEVKGAPKPGAYQTWLADNRQPVLDYLGEIGALNAPGTPDSAVA